MSRQLDPVEEEYVRAMNYVQSSDEAFELAVGLRQYRDMFKPRGRYERTRSDRP